MVARAGAELVYSRLNVLLSVFCLAGCVSLAENFADKAAMLGMTRESVIGAGFEHVLYIKDGHPSKTLHIYLDGDGAPWVAGRPSDDPTPRNPLVLNLMAQDNAPAVYLGRPCYHDAHGEFACTSRIWLKDRYSESVVASLAAVVKQLLERGGYQQLAWFGHSGGGTLAVLLASRFPQTKSVVTVAANLDIGAWARYAGDVDLNGSLNPADLPALPPAIVQRHYAGANDKIVPPTLTANAAAHLGSELIVVDDYDHVCCWQLNWRQVLDEVAD